MTAIAPRECFNIIDSAVQKQIDRLLVPEGGSQRSKGQEILGALDRLFRATIQKYPEGVAVRARYMPLTTVNTAEIDKLDLATVDAMLDARISVWESEMEPWREQGMKFEGRRQGYYRQISLRAALNIAQNNIFNFPHGTWGPLWGKSDALDLVEREVKVLKG